MRALASDWLNLRLYGSSLTFSIFMRMEFNQAIDSNRINQFLRHFNVFDVQVLYFLLWSSFAQMVQHHFDVLIKYIISSMEKKNHTDLHWLLLQKAFRSQIWTFLSADGSQRRCTVDRGIGFHFIAFQTHNFFYDPIIKTNKLVAYVRQVCASFFGLQFAWARWNSLECISAFYSAYHFAPYHIDGCIIIDAPISYTILICDRYIHRFLAYVTGQPHWHSFVCECFCPAYMRHV